MQEAHPSSRLYPEADMGNENQKPPNSVFTILSRFLSVCPQANKQTCLFRELFLIKSKIQLINKSMNGIGKMLPKKLIINPTKGFICKSTMAVNIPSLHSKIGQTEIINTTSQSGIPCAVKNSCKFLQNSCTIYQFSFLSVVVFCFLSAFDCDSLFLL